MMKKVVVFICSVVILLFINEGNCDDWYKALATRTIDMQEKLSDLIPTQTDPRTVKKVTKEMKRFADNFKIVQDKMNTGIEKLEGKNVKKTRRAENKVEQGMKKLENTVNNAERKKTRRDGNNDDDTGSLSDDLRAGISSAGKGVKEFLEGIRGAGPKGVAIALEVATAFEKIGDMLAGNLEEIG